MEVQSILSERGKKLLVFKNYKFCKSCVAKNDNVSWRCVQKKTFCPASMTTPNIDSNVVIDHNLNHNHETDSSVARQVASNSVKRKAVENLCEKPTKLIHSKIKENTFSSEITTHDIDRMRKNMYAARRGTLPPLPAEQKDVFEKIKDFKPVTNKGESFVCVNDKESKIIIFASYSNLRFLCLMTVAIFMDGIFQYCTKFFTQMFTIHGFRNGHYIPLIFVYYRIKVRLVI